jgi:hypothetical protein
MATARGVLFTQQDCWLHPEHTIARLLHRIIACLRERERYNIIIATQSEKKNNAFGHPSPRGAEKEMRW